MNTTGKLITLTAISALLSAELGAHQPVDPFITPGIDAIPILPQPPDDNHGESPIDLPPLTALASASGSASTSTPMPFISTLSGQELPARWWRERDEGFRAAMDAMQMMTSRNIALLAPVRRA
jgi:hypothetical protein